MNALLCSRWLTYLLSLTIGAAIGVIVARNPRGQVVTSSSPASTFAAPVKDPADAEVLRRLGVVREERRQSEASKQAASLDTRSGSQRTLDHNKEQLKELSEQLAVLLKRASTYQNTPDLRGPLVAALSGDSDASVAIFLEWHRRDPGAAFEELATRPGWSEEVLSREALILHLTADELLEQVGARNRSHDFRERIVEELAWYLAKADDLRTLSASYTKLHPVLAEALVKSFVSGWTALPVEVGAPRQPGWLPRDGAAALDFISHGMDPVCRKALLSELAYGTVKASAREWSEGMAAPLFKEVLGEEKLAELKQKTDEDKEDDEGEMQEEGLPDHEVVAKAIGTGDPDDVRDAVMLMLAHDKDYPELFAAGRISGDEIMRELMETFPAAVTHEAAVRLAVYQELALWNPKDAVAWAKDRLTREEQESAFTDFNELSEPRALRVVELMEELPTKTVQGKAQRGLSNALHCRLQRWREIDPAAEEATLKRFPQAAAAAQ